MAIPQPAANPRIHEVPPQSQSGVVATGEVLGTPTKGIIPKLNGRSHLETLEELLRPAENMPGVWAKRALPTPETPFEAFPVVKTCTPIRMLADVKGESERLAWSRSQVAGFTEHCDDIIPKGGHAGAWLLYFKGLDLAWAYIYRETPSQAAAIFFDFDDISEPLPGHHGHVFVVPEKR